MQDQRIDSTLTEHVWWLLLSVQYQMSKSSHERCFIKKGVLKNFTKFTLLK